MQGIAAAATAIRRERRSSARSATARSRTMRSLQPPLSASPVSARSRATHRRRKTRPRNFRPIANERQHKSAPLSRQGAHVAERARAPEPIESVEHRLGQEWLQRLHMRARGLEILSGAVDGGGDFGCRRNAATRLHHEADAQAPERGRLDDPVKLLVFEARIIANIRQRQRRHHQGAASTSRASGQPRGRRKRDRSGSARRSA